jgi:hypothetical protein
MRTIISAAQMAAKKQQMDWEKNTPDLAFIMGIKPDPVPEKKKTRRTSKYAQTYKGKLSSMDWARSSQVNPRKW